MSGDDLAVRAAVLQVQLEHAEAERNSANNVALFLMNNLPRNIMQNGTSREVAANGFTSEQALCALAVSLTKVCESLAKLASSLPGPVHGVVNHPVQDAAQKNENGLNDLESEHLNDTASSSSFLVEDQKVESQPVAFAASKLPSNVPRAPQADNLRAGRSSLLYHNIEASSANEIKTDDFFTTPLSAIRWTPPPGHRHVFRTVLITDLPADLTETEIFDHIAGGVLISLNLIPSLGQQGKTAIVQFFRDDCAEDFVSFRHDCPLTFDDKPVAINLVQTPTWPIARPIIIAIERHGLTRCLAVYTFPRHVSNDKLKSSLCEVGYRDSHGLVRISEDEFGILHLEFKSIRAAVAAFTKLTTYSLFTGCDVSYATDPCDRPVHTLRHASSIPAVAPIRACWDNIGLDRYPDALDYGDGPIGALTLTNHDARYAECLEEGEISTNASGNEIVGRAVPIGNIRTIKREAFIPPATNLPRRMPISYADIDEIAVEDTVVPSVANLDPRTTITDIDNSGGESKNKSADSSDVEPIGRDPSDADLPEQEHFIDLDY